MRRVFNSCVRGAAAAAVILALAGSAFAGPRDARDEGRNRGREGVATVVKRIVRALGDGLTVPLPKPNP
jgi:hypothetical protein